MKRVFLAVPLSKFFQSEIQFLLDQIRSEVTGVKWESPEKAHMTPHFFGPTPDSSLDTICRVVAGLAEKTAPFALSINGFGFFPHPQKPRIIWLGFKGEMQRLISFQSGLEIGLQKQGFASEGRSFHPHATLGRVKEKISITDQRVLSFPAAPFRYVDRIVLYESHLESTGSHYEILETFRLSQSAAAGRKPS